MALRLLDALVFGNVWVAAAAACCTAAAARAMGIAPGAAPLVLAFAGTLAVYALDRLLDLDADRRTAPARSAFVARHAGALRASAALGAPVAVLAAAAAGRDACLLAAGVGALGLAHRSLKRVPFGKAGYVAGAWTAVVVGVPALAVPGATDVAATAGICFGTLAANVVACSVRDDEAAAPLLGARRLLAVGRGLALAATCGALLAPAPVRVLWPLPLATLATLAAWRPGERWSLVMVDGALIAGALAALVL